MRGDNEGWLLPNGLLPNEGATVVQPLDPERWLKAEERTAELIKCIQPNKPSEDRRNAVANYVQRLISQCFPCQVFTFGSVPLKTYLPDGDIDVTAFSENQNLKDTWAHQVRDMLENEEKNENAEFRVKEVQYIQAEVKIIKCLVENIVVDISFNQLGGLCTLCFLEEVDNLINQDHLFKRSIILIKAWCYYESRILGAHHGLISTYALETLVLYIFHVFNNSFAGPLEVLYRFLEFFSKFDWENFCVSLWGPVPISSLPDVTAEPPRKDGGELLLSKLFLEACSAVYAVFPSGQENQGQPFTSKHFNVIDPLRVNNNLGRSVSKGNFFRIRSAFALGAKRLSRLLDCPKEDLYNEVNQFFFNTWDGHGSGYRPDAPKNDLWHLRLSSPEQSYKAEDVKNHSSSGTSGHEVDSDVTHGSRGVPSWHGNRSSESTSKSSEGSAVSHSQTRRSYASSNNTRHSEQNRKNTGSNQVTQVDRGQRRSKAEHMVNDLQGRYLFARTQSSPELTDTYGKAFSQVRWNRGSDRGKGHAFSALDQNRLKMYADNSVSQGSRLPIDDPSSVRQTSLPQNLASPGDSSDASNASHNDLGLLGISEESTSGFGMEDLHQEEQDFINMMASSAAIGYGEQVHLPRNLAPLAYAHRNFGGMVPSTIPMMDVPWGNNIQFPLSLVSPQFTHYFPQMGLAANSQDAVKSINEDFSSSEVNARVADNEVWHEQERSSSSGFVLNNGRFEIRQSDDMQPSSSSGYDFDHSSQLGGPGNPLRVQEKFSTEAQASLMEDHVDSRQYHGDRETEVPFDDRNAISRPYAGSDRDKASLESSWEGSHAKGPKLAREKRGRKPAAFPVPNALHGKGKNFTDHSFQADDDKDWNSLSNAGLEMVGPQSASALHISRQQVPGSESTVPMAPVLLAHDTRLSKGDSGDLPYTAFVPTGPPVPIIMVPIYNFPTETGTSDAFASQFSGEEGREKLDSSPAYISSEIADQSELLSSGSLRATVEQMDHKPDILNGDFFSHWKNLQYGRFCQNPQNPGPPHYPSPFIVPPVYLQSRLPWDGLGRPVSTNMNLSNRLVSHGSPLIPVAPLQTVSNRPNAYQHYVDEMPRYRGGTGTYLPNPKMSVQDRRPTNSRKGNYNYDKSDNHGEREGNWNSNSKTRTGGRNHGRNQAEKSSPRFNRLATESRADRSRSSHGNEEFPSYRSQNGPVRSSMTSSGLVNMPYGLYPLSSANPGGVSSNGPAIPSVMMLYPYDHAPGGYGSAEQLEYGSLGPAGFSEVSHINEGTRVNVGFEDQRVHSNSAQMSSPDQPTSPHFQR